MKKHDYAIKKYVQTEVKYIETAKYYEGIKINCDPGDPFIMRWIVDNGKTFKEKWDVSKCKHCECWKKCADLLKTECENFKIDPMEDDV